MGPPVETGRDGASRARGGRLAVALVLAATGAAGAGNVLTNAGFETGSGPLPAGWEAYGEGRVVLTEADAAGGTRCVRLEGAGSFQMLYQWTDGAAPGRVYEASLRVKRAGGSGAGGIKIEFMNAGGVKKQFEFGFTAGPEWEPLTFRALAPEDSRRAALTLVAHGGATLLFDDAALSTTAGRRSREIEFDASRLGQRVDGFGVHHWADFRKPAAEFEALNIRYIRITKDWTSWEDLEALRRHTDALGVKWLYTLWAVPEEFRDSNGDLRDVEGFASHWLETVTDLDAHGCRPPYIDLENEPDYFGIPPEPYAELVSAVRRRLDEAGFGDVVITGPGLTHVGAGNFRRYRDALDDEAASAIGVWTTHGWEDVWDWKALSGSVAVTDMRAEGFVRACRERDSGKPVWYTEYATRQITFHGTRYPHPDTEAVDDYSASSTLPYATRVYANTLAVLNRGVNVPFYWCSGDYRGAEKQWGYLDPDGAPKPVYHALKSLYGAIRPGSRMLVPPEGLAGKTVYAGACLDATDPAGPVYVVGLVNTSGAARRATVRLRRAAGPLRVLKAERVEIETWGDPRTRRADVARTVPARIRLTSSRDACEFEVELERETALTVRLGR